MGTIKMDLDIHSYDKQYSNALKVLEKDSVSQHNRKLILDYIDYLRISQPCGKVSHIRFLRVLNVWASIIDKDFDKASKKDFQRLVASLLKRRASYSPYTLANYKGILRRFMSWVLLPDQYPDIERLPDSISWLKGRIRRNDVKRIQRNDLLTPHDIDTLLNNCRNPRDKALIAILWETGGRIAEIGNLKLKHLTRTQHGYVLDLTGKTGQRTPLIVSAAPYLSQWLSSHPFKDNQESPLWVHNHYNKKMTFLKYVSICYILTRTFERTEITKPYNPHIFRHSRATYVLANGIMNESQAKTYFGWTPDSNMLAIYSHLIDKDSNDAILKENGLKTEQKKHDELKPVTCHNCNELNTPGTDYCTKCSSILDIKKAYQNQKITEEKDAIVLNLFKVLVEKGLIDEAADEVHKNGLGLKLKGLVQNAKQEIRIVEQ